MNDDGRLDLPQVRRQIVVILLPPSPLAPIALIEAVLLFKMPIKVGGPLVTAQALGALVKRGALVIGDDVSLQVGDGLGDGVAEVAFELLVRVDSEDGGAQVAFLRRERSAHFPAGGVILRTLVDKQLSLTTIRVFFLFFLILFLPQQRF